MKKILNELDYIGKLMEINKNKESAYSNVSKFLYGKIRNNKKIGAASDIAKEIGVSNALMSKFLKYIYIDGWAALKYIHNSIVDSVKISDENINHHMNKMAQEIEDAHKIFLIGVSSSLHVNRDFAMKLSRLDKWVISPDNKYEQVGLSKLLVSKDLLIVTSISLQHSWMKKIIMETKAKVVIVTANIGIAKSLDPDYIYEINPGKYNIAQTRIFTTYARRKILEYFDEVYESIISKPHNTYLLRLTTYN